MKILITGKPRAGKTTLIKRIYEELKGKVAINGFFTSEIKEKNERKGFFIENLEGKRKIFAHIDFKTNFKVGRYGVDISSLEEIGVPEIIKAIENKTLLLIDEIGKMELFSEKFKSAVEKALDSQINIIATISISPHPFIKKIKERKDVKIYEITEEKREYIFNKLKDLCLKELIKSDYRGEGI
ncbi:MAG: NTPase [Candidatus Hydrothermales bacterium]